MRNEFMSEDLFKRARHIIQKLAYRKTLDEETDVYGHLHKPHLELEGLDYLKIVFEKFSMRPEQYSKIREIEEVKDRDDVFISVYPGVDEARLVIQLEELREEEQK